MEPDTDFVPSLEEAIYLDPRDPPLPATTFSVVPNPIVTLDPSFTLAPAEHTNARNPAATHFDYSAFPFIPVSALNPISSRNSLVNLLI